jgi:acetyltransferase-like isoleucine patch superfamily enzyme
LRSDSLTYPSTLDERRRRELEQRVEDLRVGSDVKVGDNVQIAGGTITIGDGTTIHDGCRIWVSESLTIGRRSVIGKGAIIRGREITLGREFYCLDGFEIGGGSCFERLSKLRVGYWFHGGRETFINTARSVEIGDEVGIGGRSNLYTHGAYLNVLDGFPEQWGEIHIGSNVWIPNATIHPNVRIGSNVVIGGGSIVTRDVPSGCLAAGAPCRVIREACYPKPLDRSRARKKLLEILLTYRDDYTQSQVTDAAQIVFQHAIFDPFEKTIAGNATTETELLRDRLRRHGIRFKVDVHGDRYESWDSDHRGRTSAST